MTIPQFPRFERLEHVADPTDAARETAAMTEGAMSVVFTAFDVSRDASGMTITIPIFFVSADDRPDLRDLTRICRLEPTARYSSRVELAIGRVRSIAVLKIAWETPVDVEMRVVLDFDEHDDAIRLLARHGEFEIALSRPIPGQRYDSLVASIDPRPIRFGLAAHLARRSL